MAPEAIHSHDLIRTRSVIACSGCTLRVTRPKGVPDYRRAGMRWWR